MRNQQFGGTAGIRSGMPSPRQGKNAVVHALHAQLHVRDTVGFQQAQDLFVYQIGTGGDAYACGVSPLQVKLRPFQQGGHTLL
ncbi:MAG: hypothetical protein IJW34_01255 [Clostridia bacterium]|nr:hypothetical protein [Clostridia bacterium]